MDQKVFAMKLIYKHRHGNSLSRKEKKFLKRFLKFEGFSPRSMEHILSFGCVGSHASH